MSRTVSTAHLHRNWLEGVAPHDDLWQHLEQLPWEQKEIWMFGRQIPLPRLTCWVGDQPYTYSGVENQPHPWTWELNQIRQALADYCGTEFNSCLLNLYRNGDDSVGFHQDNEPGLGPNPVIATLSLGESRRFVMRHVDDHSKQLANTLHAGDLLVMGGDSQTKWQHSVPKDPRITDPRISLTFRRFG